MEIQWDWELTIFKIWGFKKKFLLFAFVRQCLSKNLTEIHLNRVINYLTRKLRKKWAKKVKWNVILTKTLKMTRDFSQFFLLLCSVSSWEPNISSKCLFSSILILFTLIYCIQGYPTELKVYLKFSNF
jgi:hypothetical protein